MLLLASCRKDFLVKNNPNAVAAANYYQSENDVLLALNGVYQASIPFNEAKLNPTGMYQNPGY